MSTRSHLIPAELVAKNSKGLEKTTLMAHPVVRTVRDGIDYVCAKLAPIGVLIEGLAKVDKEIARILAHILHGTGRGVYVPVLSDSNAGTFVLHI